MFVGIKIEQEDDRRILVRQCYPYKTEGKQESEAARRRAMEEVSRTITREGTVIKAMKDGSTQVGVVKLDNRS